MKTKYYFKHKDSEICYTKEYFDNYMKENNIKQYDVYEAISERIGGSVFWCKKLYKRTVKKGIENYKFYK